MLTVYLVIGFLVALAMFLKGLRDVLSFVGFLLLWPIFLLVWIFIAVVDSEDD